MTLRHLAPAPLLAVAVFACTPSVPSNPNTFVPTAMFDPTTGNFPVPSALAINPLLNPYVLHPRNAQDELLGYFYAQGGFPPDQVLPLGFPIAALTVNGPNDVTSTAPTLDMGSIVPCTGQQAPGNCNLFVFDALGTPEQAFPALATSYQPGATQGTLSAVPVSGGKPTTWRPGATYFYALRGGSSGIKTQANVPLQPSSTMFTLLFGRPSDFACPSTTPDCALKQLQQLQLLFAPVFAAVQNRGFPLEETVVVGAFTVAPATTWVIADPNNTIAPLPVPLPSDFLIDPTTGRITTAFDAQIPGASSLDGFSTTAMIIAPTSGNIDATTVRNPAALPGVFLYEIGPTTAVKVPDVVDALLAAPAPVKPVYVAEPPQIQFSGLSPLIGLQPAVPVSGTGYSFMLPALKENTEYGVIITTRVKDAAGRALSKTTLGQIELFTQPLCTPSPGCASSPATAKSEVPGVDGPTASGLEAMRLSLQKVTTQLAADTGCATTPPGPGCVTKAEVAMAYTFRTQSISGKYATAAFGGKGGPGAIQISAIPYTPLLQLACAALQQQLALPSLDCTKPLPGTVKEYTGATAGSTVADAFTAWGVDLSVPHDKIDAIYELQIMTPNKIDDSTGALNPSPTGVKPEVLTVLVAVPPQSRVPACTGPLAPFAGAGLRCAPLVVFQHGITTAKNYGLTVANTLVDAGNVVVAIDLPWHGQRSYCSIDAVPGNPDAACAPGNHCVPVPAMAGQGAISAPTPGLCRTGTTPTSPLGAFLNRAALCLDPGTAGVPGSSCASVPGLPNPIALNPATGAPTNAGFPFTSGQFYLSANFFRSRDTARQLWIDHTQLMQVLAPQPVAGPMAGNDFYNALLVKGILVNPLDISFVSQSLGSFFATGSTAANPRVSRAVFNTNGATMIDLFFNSPTYQGQADALLSSLGINMALVRHPPAPGSADYPAYLQAAAQYLLYVNALKLINDPADPINAATHVTDDPWPNLLPPLGGNTDGSVAQVPKKSLAQFALCDQSVANPFNALVAGNLGLAPFLPPAAPGTGTVQWFGTPLVQYPAFDGIYPTPCTIAVDHEFLISFGFEHPPLSAARAAVRTLTLAAQSSAASWLANPTVAQPSLVIAP